jgi:hypothetical protein
MPVDKPIIIVPEDITAIDLRILKSAYALDETDFNILVGHSTGFKDWAKRILFISIGWAIKLVSIFIIFLFALFSDKTQDKNSLAIGIDLWEILALGIALFTCCVLFFCGYLWMNPKDKKIKEIKKHFSNHNIK